MQGVAQTLVFGNGGRVDLGQPVVAFVSQTVRNSIRPSGIDIHRRSDG